MRKYRYESVWSYKTVLPNQRDVNVDVFVCAGKADYSLIWEVKNRHTKAFSVAEAEAFVEKARRLKERERLERTLFVVFSRKGFTWEVLEFFRTHGIAWSDDEGWLGDGVLGG